MARSKTSERDAQHDLTRRALIKWSVAAGAALGVSRGKILEVLEKSAGKGVAMAAADSPTARSVHVIAGNGSLAWMTLQWPHHDIAMAANPKFSYQKPGMATLVPGTTNPLAIGPDTAWSTLPAQRQVTAFLCGSNETHTKNATSTSTIGGVGLFAAITALQSASQATIPQVVIGDAQAGTAPGAAKPALVGNADGVVGLFNSVASSMGGLLSNASGSDAALFKAHFETLIQLNRAANRSTTKTAYTTATGAAGFLGKNLAAQLQVNNDDLMRYGLAGPVTVRNSVAQMARALIITAKAFKLNLTNSVMFPAQDDDPHGAFDSKDVDVVPGQMKTMFNAFMDDLTRYVDENGKPLADNTVITFTGDTYKNPLNPNGWGDGTPKNTNLMYVYGAGHLKTGWFGGVDRAGAVLGFGADGKPAPYVGADTAKFAAASVLYAIAKRDERAIASFANGIKVGGVFGNLKDI
jgi:hypothetical protein